eukprot:gene24199-30518_t
MPVSSAAISAASRSLNMGVSGATAVVAATGTVAPPSAPRSNHPPHAPATQAPASAGSSNNLKAGSYAQNVTGTLTGTDADNYSFTGLTTSSSNYTVNKLALTGAAIADVTTTYGTAANTGAVSFTNVIASDVVTPSTASLVTPSYSSSNNLKAGSYAQNVTGTLTGTDADNYSFTGLTTSGTNYTVNKLALTGASIADVSTTYGTAANTGAVTFTNVIASDVVTPSTATLVTPSYSSSNNLKAGSYAQNVTSTLSGTDSDNYSFTGLTTSGTNYTVSKLALTGAAIAGVTTTYGTPANTGAVTFTNVIASDVVTPGTATLVTPSYSSSNNLKAGSYAQNVTGTLTGTDADNYSFTGLTTSSMASTDSGGRGYDEVKIRKFALAFLHSSQDGVRDMEAALACGDMDSVRQLGHRIKGAARTVGAFGMGDLCEQLEDANKGQAEATAIAGQLQAQLQQVAAHIAQNTGNAAA